jgi:hypothetical protein
VRRTVSACASMWWIGINDRCVYFWRSCRVKFIPCQSEITRPGLTLVAIAVIVCTK